MAARSIGDTRIFRVAHRDPRYVALGLRALAGWRRWEADLAAALVGADTTVISGASASTWAEAMAAADADFRLLDDASEIPLPMSPTSKLAEGPFVVDPLGGVLALRHTGSALAAALGGRLRSGDPVDALEPLPGGGLRIRSASGSWDADAALILAGAGTPALAATVGVGGIPRHLEHHHRFTFPLVDDRPFACWLDQSEAWRSGFTSYQHLVGPGRWAIGGSLPDDDTAWELGTEETRRRAERDVTAYVREHLDGVRPEVVETVHCDAMGLGDGIGTAQIESIVVLWGDNLAKFAPLLGELLARSATSGQIVPELAELQDGRVGAASAVSDVAVQPSRTPPT
jgi:sarcosine oxidase